MTTKLGIALENTPPGTCPRVRRVGPDGAAAGVLKPDDIIVALDGQPLNVGTAAATELLRNRVGTMVLTVQRVIPDAALETTPSKTEAADEGQQAEGVGEGIGSQEVQCAKEKADEPQGDQEEEEEDEEEDADDEDLQRIRAALAELRARATSEGEDKAGTLEGVAEETVRLASALKEATTGGYQELMARAVRKTEAKLAKERILAVEAATVAAAKATEVRLKEAHKQELKMALESAAAKAASEKEAAVAEAIRETEERCAEQQRIAVMAATAHAQSALGVSPEDVAASAATMAFREASASAGAALAAALQLQKEHSSRPAPKVDDEAAVDVAGGNNLYFF
eukprot:scaffold133345_cov37-Tisochrysis_lutea.AAC.1